MYDPEGIKLDVLFDIKQVKKANFRVCRPCCRTTYHGKASLEVKSAICGITLCSPERLEMEKRLKTLIKSEFASVEEQICPSDEQAVDVFLENHFLYMPGKAANAGSVAVTPRGDNKPLRDFPGGFEEVDEKLKGNYAKHFPGKRIRGGQKRYGREGNFEVGVMWPALRRITETVLAQGLV